MGQAAREYAMGQPGIRICACPAEGDTLTVGSTTYWFTQRPLAPEDAACLTLPPGVVLVLMPATVEALCAMLNRFIGAPLVSVCSEPVHPHPRKEE